MMKKTFGINGFGRIGRTSLRVWWQYYRDQADLKVINTSGSMEVEDWAHLLKYDTNYGVFGSEVRAERHQSKDEVSDENPVLGTITLDGNYSMTVLAQRDPNKIPWGQHGVQAVIEATGVFVTEEKAAQHLAGGAETVIISAPAKGEGVSTAIVGVNNFDSNNKVRSNASCTTNCVAPVAQLMVRHFGVEKAMLTTIHAYTDDQNTQDNSHKDLRRARSAAENIIPTTTGAAKATAEVVPELQGLFDGLAMRVPVRTGSISDMVFLVRREVTIEAVNQVFINAAQEEKWQNILAVTHEPLVSSDIVGRRESSIVDLNFTNVIGGNLVKVVSWYDNEWGYCNRLIEQVWG